MMLPTPLQSLILGATALAAVALGGAVECRAYETRPEEECWWNYEPPSQTYHCEETGQTEHRLVASETCGSGSGENLASNLPGAGATPVRPVALLGMSCRACGGTSACHDWQTGQGHVSCDGGGGGASNETVKQIRAGVRIADAAILKELLTSKEGVSFNRERGSIQALGCGGRILAHNIDLPRALASQLEAALSE